MSLETGTCRSLGSRLRDIENATIDAVYNDSIDFQLSDWMAEGSYYVMTFTVDQHQSGNKPMMQVYEKRGSQYHSVTMDSIILQANGTFKIRVLADPDLRFEGRLIVDE